MSFSRPGNIISGSSFAPTKMLSSRVEFIEIDREQGRKYQLEHFSSGEMICWHCCKKRIFNTHLHKGESTNSERHTSVLQLLDGRSTGVWEFRSVGFHLEVCFESRDVTLSNGERISHLARSAGSQSSSTCVPKVQHRDHINRNWHYLHQTRDDLLDNKRLSGSFLSISKCNFISAVHWQLRMIRCFESLFLFNSPSPWRNTTNHLMK